MIQKSKVLAEESTSQIRSRNYGRIGKGEINLDSFDKSPYRTAGIAPARIAGLADRHGRKRSSGRVLKRILSLPVVPALQRR